jgi:hypothetical protein
VLTFSSCVIETSVHIRSQVLNHNYKFFIRYGSGIVKSVGLSPRSPFWSILLDFPILCTHRLIAFYEYICSSAEGQCLSFCQKALSTFC